MSAPPRKRIHLIRHAEALHNVTGNTSITDPPLTPLGLEQAAEIPRTALPARSAQVVIASPLRRTLQTATFGFPQHAEKGTIIAFAELQEAGPNACDHGKEDINADFTHVDFSQVSKGWSKKEGRNEATHEAHMKRATFVRRWLRARSETEIAVVSHWGFLFYLSNPDPLTSLDEGWRNTECRTFVFKADDDEAAELVLLEDKEPPLAKKSAATPLPQGLPSMRA